MACGLPQAEQKPSCNRGFFGLSASGAVGAEAAGCLGTGGAKDPIFWVDSAVNGMVPAPGGGETIPLGGVSARDSPAKVL